MKIDEEWTPAAIHEFMDQFAESVASLVEASIWSIGEPGPLHKMAVDGMMEISREGTS